MLYQQPSAKVWIWNLEADVWVRGPDLPSPILRGTAHVSENEIWVSGGVQLIVNPPESSKNQIYEYTSNTKVFKLANLESEGWVEVLDLQKFSNNCEDYSLYAVIPTKCTFPCFKISKGKVCRQLIQSDLFPTVNMK